MATDYTKLNLKTVRANKQRFLTEPTKLGKNFVHDNNNVLLLQTAQRYWSSGDGFRTRRARSRRYYRGDQWGDIIFNPDTQTYMTEDSYIRLQGKVPLKQNKIRPLVKNLIGQYRTDTTKAAVIARKRVDAVVSEMLTNTLQYGINVNEGREKDTRLFEEFLLSGAAVQKIGFEYFPKLQSDEVKLRNVPIPHMFSTPNIKNVEDDIKFIGQMHDMYVKDIIAGFAQDSEKKAKEISEIYGYVSDPNIVGGISAPALGPDYIDSLDFYTSVETDKGRVFEIWYERNEWRLRCHDMQKGETFIMPLSGKNAIDEENRARYQNALAQFAVQYPEMPEQELKEYTMSMVPLIEYKKSYESYWYVKFLSPYGHLLYEMETPYEHKSHPYTMILYPLVDGEAWGFVEDIIDQQRYINRMVTLLDSIIGATAKGVLIIDKNSIPDDMKLEDIAQRWTEVNGVIALNLKKGAVMPEQMAAKSSNVGIHEMLALQERYLSEDSGVSGAIQGQDGKGKSGTLFAQETQNSTLNSKDYFESFNNYKNQRNWKMLKVQIQFYPEERQLALSGSNVNDEALTYKRDKVKDLQFEMTMGRAPDSPIYRAVIEQNLKEFLGAEFINFETYLRNTSLPFADNLLVEVQRQNEQLVKGQGFDPTNSMQQIGGYLQSQGADASQANPEAMRMLSQMKQ